MKSNEVLQRFFKKHGTKQLAATLGLSEPFLYKWCQPDGGKATGGWNPIERILVVTLATGDRSLVEFICKQAGGRFVQGEALRSLICQDCEQLITKLEGVMRASGKQTGARRWEMADGEKELNWGRCRYRLADGRCGRR